MRTISPLIAAGLASILAGAAQAQPSVSPFTVMPDGPPPKIVSSFPVEGQAAKPGVLILRVTFDQKMQMDDFAYGATPGSETLDCVKTPRLLNDDKSFVLLCRAWPGKSYGVTFNAAPAGGFANEGGHRAQPATLNFTTTTGEPVRALGAAMKAAGLSDLDMPVQETSNVASSDTLAP